MLAARVHAGASRSRWFQAASAAAICFHLTLGQASAQFLDFLFGQPPETKPPPAAAKLGEAGPGGHPSTGKPKHKAKPKSGAADKSQAEAKSGPAKAEEALPPYDPELLRLAEILGALTYLDRLCTATPTADWRAKMQALLEAEGKTETRKERLAGSYNRGFRDYERTYHFCTPNAQAAIGRFLAEGGKIAHEVVSRYGTS